LPPPLPAPSVPLGINLVVVDSDASMLGDESGDTDSEEEQLFTEMIVRLSAAASSDPTRKLLLAAKGEELTRTNKAREARAKSAAQFGRSSRSASSHSLCLTIRLTETNIKRYVENVIRRSVMEGTLTSVPLIESSDSSSPERSRPIATEQ